MKKKEIFNPNHYKKFFLPSPATLLAKKKFCNDNNINFGANLINLISPWKKLIKTIYPSFSEKDARNLGKKIATPFKLKYDKWMKIYKKKSADYYKKNQRRLITRI